MLNLLNFKLATLYFNFITARLSRKLLLNVLLTSTLQGETNTLKQGLKALVKIFGAHVAHKLSECNVTFPSPRIYLSLNQSTRTLQTFFAFQVQIFGIHVSCYQTIMVEVNISARTVKLPFRIK